MMLEDPSPKRRKSSNLCMKNMLLLSQSYYQNMALNIFIYEEPFAVQV